MAFYQNAYLCLNCVQTAIACTFCTALCATCCASAADVERNRKIEKTVVVVKSSNEDIQIAGTNGSDLPLLDLSQRKMDCMERV